MITEMEWDRVWNHQAVRRGFTHHYSLPHKRESLPEEKSRTRRNTTYQWLNRLVNYTVHILVTKLITISESNTYILKLTYE